MKAHTKTAKTVETARQVKKTNTVKAPR